MKLKATSFSSSSSASNELTSLQKTARESIPSPSFEDSSEGDHEEIAAAARRVPSSEDDQPPHLLLRRPLGDPDRREIDL
jgi:hypothetical protein